MIVKPGSIYRDNGVDFIVAVERIGDGAVHVRLINVANWIVLAGHPGKPLANGGIDVVGLAGELVAATVADYFTPQTKPKKARKARTHG